MKIFQRMGKRGQNAIVGIFAVIIGLAAVLMIAGIFQAYGAKTVSDVQADFTANSVEYNITQENLEAQADLGESQGTLTNVGVAAVIISLLIVVAAGIGIKLS